MTVATEIDRSGPYAGAGTTGPFLVNFRILDASHLRVVKLQADGIEVTIAYPADYSVAGVGNPTCSLTTTAAVAVGETLTIVRSVPKTQEADYVQNDDFPAESHEDALDKLTMITQELGEGLDRALTLPVSSATGVSTELPAPEPEKLIGWNAAGDKLQNFDASTLATIVAFGTSQVDIFSGTGAQLDFVLTANPGVLANLDISIGGVDQRAGIDYTWSGGTTLTFTSAPPLGTNNIQVKYKQALPQGYTTDDLVGVQQPLTGSFARTQHDVNLERVSVLNFIPPAQHAAILAYTSTYDATDDINRALAATPVVELPPGLLRVTRPINMSARRDASGAGLYGARRLIGKGSAKTIIDAYTGVYPCVDLTGASGCVIDGVWLRSDNPPAGLTAADCASVGIMARRGSTHAFNQQCHQPYFRDVRINLTSDMARNGGLGTVGAAFCGSEHAQSDYLHIYANVRFYASNLTSQPFSNSSSIPTYGAQYEPPYAGAAISTTVHEHRSAMLIGYDSFRAIYLEQCAGFSFPNLYTSTRKLVSSSPAYSESFRLASCSNIFIDCYQEEPGLFGATYRMGHRYFTFSGDNENIKATVQRGVADYGFTLPGAAVPSVHLENATYLANSDLNCNYTIGIYNASGDNNGFAALPVTFTGTPNGIKNVKFTLDRSGSHSADIYSAIGPYCTNVDSINYFSGDNYYGSLKGSWTPVARGSGTAGSGTYTFQGGTWSKAGRALTFSASLSWSAHTGVGNLQITGLPFNSDANVEQAVSVYYDGLTTVAGRQLVCKTQVNSGNLLIFVSDPSGGGVSGFAFDAAVTSLVVSGTIVMA